MYFVIKCFQKGLFSLNKSIGIGIFIFINVINTYKIGAEEKYVISNSWEMGLGLKLKGNLRTAGNTFELSNEPNQNSENQASSSSAFSPNLISGKFSIDFVDWVSLKLRMDYYWDKQVIYNLFPKYYEENTVHVRDLYLLFPNLAKTSSFWLGRRTYEFDNIYLFQIENPFNQIELQGLGFENEVFQASVSLNKETVFTTAKDQSGNQILDSSGKAKLFSEDDYVFTAFFSGKFLLSEGKIFQPILSLRYYQEFADKNVSSDGSKKDTVANSSSFIVGGIFLRPLTDGIKGHTSVWFQSLPADKAAQPNNNTGSSSYIGQGRIPPNYPQNTIGILDSSEFYFTPYGGILTAFILTNNTYASELPVLRVADDKKSLESDGRRMSRSTNRLSVDIQPVYFFTRNWQMGLDISFVYASQKLIATDANSFVVTPILKYSFDEKLSTNKYFFVSCSYGFYDWKIKTLQDETQTDILFTTQSGINITF
ncbi:hypothetical protein [Fluviispira multicolorata]|uniref:Uncharacterized protein n=1 Tax=Fluviispira multicolorata TaxID=2654512 RepID=A0A833N2E8_9BACT|nr:hypothetical protein [Fluviispira multicolorata]KAB8028057.1 hypothetical protein GCL57_13475 [Fluviispira multicolorata]